MVLVLDAVAVFVRDGVGIRDFVAVREGAPETLAVAVPVEAAVTLSDGLGVPVPLALMLPVPVPVPLGLGVPVGVPLLERVAVWLRVGGMTGVRVMLQEVG